jgi:transcriptional regulator with XRE-family HTH domain
MQTEELQKKIGGEIKKLRLVNEWTQEQIAEQLYICRDAYGDIERGKTDICLSRLAQIADFFGVDVTFLFGSSPCTTNYTQYNSHVKNRYNHNQCQLYSAEEKLQHENELQQKEIAMQQREIEQLNKMIVLLEKQQANIENKQ